MRIPDSMRVTTIELTEVGISNTIEYGAESELQEFLPKNDIETEQDREVLSSFLKELDGQREKLVNQKDFNSILKDDNQNDNKKEESENLSKDKVSDDTRSCDEYFLHEVTPNDTIQGIILRYGVDFSNVRKLNGMTSDRLTSYSVLKIPKQMVSTPTHMKPIETSSPQDVLLHAFKAINPELGLPECRVYLAESNWVLERAIHEYQQDCKWEKDVTEQKSKGSKKDYNQIHAESPCLNKSFFGFSFNRRRSTKYKAL
uniref:LysM domain-containing protein n=1 Tax=Aplanochytrium stocchinoi TaxID=215587 RepID=A0A6S8EI30_9STRA|mmetsp:Transcript_7777/g.9860  ORF Transcript_7777/g.9860 Transcript_7777/m.9860 type:complete len:258 (+) Transcript_7777:254-1027(+)|eukprot:CAMPEP_0204824208 /NCGR_PEP_ID=MMETSP1346-20131115/2239_1 /ASSEMBLY_ACC=CAM_ASM_000771 /TAXON_ID=215587 /ORGANISM="Aplanochytrium stocchinoi, Strain GSBS06" /LENGTH=257 /DNA_ID=CAMNT_0051951231 /DNA_START=409 /DNA_END=1182 /DNA_ORIENTATION=+